MIQKNLNHHFPVVFERLYHFTVSRKDKAFLTQFLNNDATHRRINGDVFGWLLLALNLPNLFVGQSQETKFFAC